MSTAYKTYYKSPIARLDYKIDWEAWLVGDTLTASTWAATGTLTIVSSSFTDTTATCWVEAGNVGDDCTIVNLIETAGGRKDERTINIKIVQQ